MSMKITYYTTATPDQVYAYLSQMDLFVQIHPVIHKIELIGVNAYLVHEKLTVGIIPFSFKYPVKISVDLQQQSVSFVACIFKLTHVRMDFVIREIAGQTHVEETLDIKTILPIAKNTYAQIKKQHELMFKNLDQIKPDANTKVFEMNRH